MVQQSPSADTQWEDISSESEGGSVPPEGSLTSSRTPSSPTPRRRKPGSRTQHVASPSTSKSSVRKERARQVYGNLARADERDWQKEGQDALVAGANATAGYAHDVARTTYGYLSLFVRLLKHPLGLLLAVYVLSLALSRAAHHLRSTFAPLCILPGVSQTALCAPGAGSSRSGAEPAQSTPRWADFARLAEVQGRSFEQLLDGSAGGSGLALEIKKAEMATADLATAVGVSKLTSRELLADSLRGFGDDAKIVGRGLQKFHAKIGGAVDKVLAVNDYALHSIEEANADAKSLSATLRGLVPFAGPPPVREVVLATFSDAMAVLSAELERLILDGERILGSLDALDAHLGTVHAISAREDAAAGAARDDLLAALWTRLGGNRRQLRGLDARQALLAGVDGYRRQAQAHVVGALQTLQGMSADMEELRERVAAPEIVGDRIPVEVHLRSIRLGLERLREGRVRAREVEEETVRRVLGGGDPEEEA